MKKMELRILVLLFSIVEIAAIWWIRKGVLFLTAKWKVRKQASRFHRN